jgi:hypothetical protein
MTPKAAVSSGGSENLGEVEGGDAIDSDGGIVFHCVHCDRPAHFHGHGLISCWRMRCSRFGLL